jgi:aspartate dehydrogenase
MDTEPVRVGLIGLGSVEQAVVRMLEERAPGEIQVVAAVVRDPARHRDCAIPSLVTTVDELISAQPEVVIEAGGHRALREYGPAVLRAGCDLLMISVGALADPAVERALIAAAASGGSHARVVSGAIGALDALAAAAIGGLTRVTHITCKPASTLLGDGEREPITEAQELFRGTAREAALKFPESVNVAAAVSLSGIGFDRTEVRVVADPTVTRNQHIVEAEGAFGSLRLEIMNIPSDTNPRTARLVAMCVVHTLLQRRSSFLIG